MNKILIPALILPFSMSALGGDYQFEADASYSQTETGDLDTDITAAGFTYYFNAVDDSKGPLAEAAFINKASNISIAYAEGEADQEDGSSLDTDAVALAIEYIVPDSSTILGLRYGEGEVEDVDIDILGITVGKYITDNLSFTVDIDYLEIDDADNSEQDNYGFNFHYLSGESEGKKLALDIGLIRSEFSADSGDDDVNTIYADATVYLNNRWGISGGWAVIHNEGDTISASTQYFVTESIALELGYEHTSYTDSDQKSDSSLILALTGRF